MPTVTSIQELGGVIDGSSDLLNAAQAFVHEQSGRLGWEAGIAAATSAVVCIVLIAWHRRFRGPFENLCQPVGIFVVLLLVVFFGEFLIVQKTDPVAPRERFTFIDVPSEHSFATLAIFTAIPQRVRPDENGIFHVYARAYYSKRPDAIADVRIWVDSPRLNVSKVSQRELTGSMYGRTRGAEVVYEYRADKLGRHAIREHFAVAIKRAATDASDTSANGGKPDKRKPVTSHESAKAGDATYSTDIVEVVDVVTPVSLYALGTNDSVWKIGGLVGPLLLAAFGLSAGSTKDKDTQKKGTS